jgi:pimeloyl-ACP methyl ester carboxylesterase
MRDTRFLRLFPAALILAILAGGVLRAQSSGSAAKRRGGASASTGAAAAKPTIVLVHGAFADALGWQRLIPILQRDGYDVIAAEIPLASLAGDVETTRRLVDGVKGPVVLVGHSYGGGVITGAAAGSSNVKALVYLAAFAPEGGEPLGAFGEKYPVDLNSALQPDSAGFLYVDRARFRELFCADVPAADARVAAATQKPVHSSVFAASVPTAAWKTIPSWYLVSQDDHAINPDLERFYAKRMNARTSEVKSSHVAFISHPDVVARLIEQAAAAAGKKLTRDS